jgi:hypothetical protein
LIGCGVETPDPTNKTTPVNTDLSGAGPSITNSPEPVMAPPPPGRCATAERPDRAAAEARDAAETMRALSDSDHAEEIEEDGDEEGDRGMAGVRETGFAPDDGTDEDDPDDDAENGEDDMAGVRETGFREDEDEMAGVRETGFHDAPDLRISAMDGTIALLEWTPIEEVQRYVITGEQFSHDSETSIEIRIEVSGTTYALETNGLRTLVRVRAVDDDGEPLSKQSNTVEIFGT